MCRKVWFKPELLSPGTWLVLLGMLIASGACASPSWAASVYCELAALPALPLTSASTERFTPEELLNRVAESYRGLLEFAGDELSEVRLRALVSANSAVAESAAELAKFFEPVTVAEQRSVALNESLTKLGDWVLLEAEEHGLTQSVILERLRETVRVRLERLKRERERAEETREQRRDPGAETLTGVMFYRDTSHPELGEAWRDPSGMIWGDTVKDPYGSVLIMNQIRATEYCLSIGAELPSNEDFIRLREYMGAQPGAEAHSRPSGYTPQILPGLGTTQSWSSTVHPKYSSWAYNFWGEAGMVYDVSNSHGSVSVRCVVRSQRTLF